MVNMVVSQVCGRDASHGTYMVRQLTVITNHPDAVAPHEGGVESPRVTRGRDISDRVIPQNQCLVTRRLQELATAASSSAAASATWTRSPGSKRSVEGCGKRRVRLPVEAQGDP